MSSEEPVITGETTDTIAPVSPGEPVLSADELNIDSLEMPEALEVEIPDVEMPDLEMPDLDLSDLELSNMVMPENEFGMTGTQDAAFGELFGEGDIEKSPIVEEQSDDSFFEKLLTMEETPAEGDIGELPEDLLPEKGLAAEELSVEENDAADIGIVEEFRLEDLEPEILEPVNLDTGNLVLKDMEVPEMETLETEMPELSNIPDTGKESSLEDIEMPGSEDEFKLEDLGMSAEMSFQENELNIDGLDQAIQSETELQMAGELNIDELGLDNIGSGSDDLTLMDDSEAPIDMDDSLEDVLNMLDDDTELAEINDMLKKSDNNEPIQDDMMDLLHQMADDEAASVNAGIKHPDDEDDGIPLPEIPRAAAETSDGEDEARKKEKKGKKAGAKKKKRGKAEEEAESTQASGKLGKFFNMLTEDIVPEPTEEELAAEKEAKEAKKQENKTKKEEEKLAKAEEKKAKAEEKAAADKIKRDAAAQKKKEKQAKREAAKAAKAAAEGKKKRIPPKKIAVAVAFGVSVGGAIVLASNILSTQGFLQTARNAYYDGDYKTVYEATYGMELDDTENDGLIKAKSEVIFKIQRRYDSYQNNMKMGREVEALDALLRGITVYDNINADAEKYGVMAEVDAIKASILNTLETEYGLDETEARAIIYNQDAVSYTIALNEVIAGK